ncbi:hypothetical protein GKO32_37725, partial [Amycolatopsis sp. RM579]|nr:hypothetical protein [Amycolatopsis pithecellobii]
MRRTLLRVAAWAAATVAAMLVSWFGVHSVLATDVTAPQAIPITAVVAPPASSPVSLSPKLSPTA